MSLGRLAVANASIGLSWVLPPTPHLPKSEQTHLRMPAEVYLPHLPKSEEIHLLMPAELDLPHLPKSEEIYLLMLPRV